MSQPSSMFVAGDISQTILGAFFLGHPVERQILLKYFSNFQNLSFPKILKNMKFLEIFGNTISKCPNFIGNIKPNCLQSCPCIDLKLLINHYESHCIRLFLDKKQQQIAA